jgi:hypothetical protein
MNARMTGWVITVFASLCLAGTSLADDDVSVRKDLFTVITLHGLPCGEVVNYTTKSDNDHVAVCKDGNRYHVFVNAQGRVVVEKQ